MEFLVTAPGTAGTSERDVEDVRTRDAAHTREPAARGRVPPVPLRVWRTDEELSGRGPRSLPRPTGCASRPCR